MQERTIRVSITNEGQKALTVEPELNSHDLWISPLLLQSTALPAELSTDYKLKLCINM